MLPRLRCKQDFSWEPKTLLVSTIISIRFARYYTPPLFPSLLISFFSFVVLSLLRIHGIESAFSFLCFVAYLVSYFETTSFSSPYIPFETFDFVCFPSVATYSINVLYFLLNRDLWFIDWMEDELRCLACTQWRKWSGQSRPDAKGTPFSLLPD